MAPPRSEHPCPIFQREAWLGLNGPNWEFAIRKSSDEEPPLEWDGNITVPFCLQSELSGTSSSLPEAKLQQFRPPLAKPLSKSQVLWYRLRLPRLPPAWRSEDMRVILHIGACSFSSTVIVNRTTYPEHVGGSTPIRRDITNALHFGGRGSGEACDELLVRCTDREDSHELLPVGKQCRKCYSGDGPHLATVYSNVTGIWQSVWLEAVPRAHLEHVKVVPLGPDQTGGRNWRVALYPKLSPLSAAAHDGLVLEASLHDRLDCLGAPVASVRAKLQGGAGAGAGGGGGGIELPVPAAAARLWSPEDPHLFGLRLRLLAERSRVVDEVLSYVGLRSVRCEEDQVLLNGKPIYLRFVLDQGYYPDGLWTAPSAAAIAKDIKLAQSLGFNGARLHQKVFEPLYFFHADLAGFLVAAEYPDWPGEKSRRWELPEGYRSIVCKEWKSAVDHLHNHPSIIMWTTLNEMGPSGGWKYNVGPGGGFRSWRSATARARSIREHGEFVKALVAGVRRRDRQGRPVHDVSGWVHVPAARPDLWSIHDYSQATDRFKRVLESPPAKYVEGRKGQPLWVSEYGGVGFEAGGPVGRNPKKFLAGYRGGMRRGPEARARIRDLTSAIYATSSVAGFCYTQLYDIEYEKNGLLRYDRKAKPGLTVAALRKIFDGRLQAGRWAAAPASSSSASARLRRRRRPGALAAQLARKLRARRRSSPSAPAAAAAMPPAKRRRRLGGGGAA